MSLSKIGLVFSALLASSAPFIFSNVLIDDELDRQFPGWPAEYEGKPLTQLQLTEKEQVFIKDFPGKVGRFSDGQRELIIRWVKEPTRKLHPAADCFKGIGYYIKPQAIQTNEQGIKMGCFTASKSSGNLTVCEHIEAPDGTSWSDISAWYWGAVFNDSSDGWMSYVIAKKS